MKARLNPFRTERLEALTYRAPEFSWPAVESRLATLGGCGAIIGPQGSGKTTLLTEWARRRHHAGRPVLMLRVAEHQRRWTDEQTAQLAACHGHSLFVDGAEQLGWLARRTLHHAARVAAETLITTHRARIFRTVFQCQTTAALLADLIAELGAPPTDCATLWNRHAGNIRNALRELYDRASSNKNCQKIVQTTQGN